MSTLSRIPGPRPARPEVGTRRLVGGGVLALLLAVLLAVTHAPVVLRAGIALPLLVGVAGAGVAQALGVRLERRDRLARTGLVLLLGVTVLALAGLIVAETSHGLGTDRLVLTTAVLAALGLAGAAVGDRPGRATDSEAANEADLETDLDPRADSGAEYAAEHDSGTRVAGAGLDGSRSASPRNATWATAAAGVLLVVLAMLAGHALLPKSSAAPTLAFTGSAATGPAPIATTPGGTVTLDWSARHTGRLPAGQMLQAVFDGQPTTVTSDVTPAANGVYSGRAVLTAPTVVGLHRVVLSLPLPSQRLELVTYVDVRPAG